VGTRPHGEGVHEVLGEAQGGQCEKHSEWGREVLTRGAGEAEKV